jgi:hypothetical protein
MMVNKTEICSVFIELTNWILDSYLVYNFIYPTLSAISRSEAMPSLLKAIGIMDRT